MYAHALGKDLLDVASSEKCVYGFAVKGQDNNLQIYLLNKSERTASVELSIENAAFDTVKVSTEAFVSPGVIVTTDLGESAVRQPLAIELSPSSFNRIVVKKK